MRDAPTFVKEHNGPIDAAQHEFLVIRTVGVAADLRLQRNGCYGNPIEFHLVDFIHGALNCHFTLPGNFLLNRAQLIVTEADKFNANGIIFRPMEAQWLQFGSAEFVNVNIGTILITHSRSPRVHLILGRTRPDGHEIAADIAGDLTWQLPPLWAPDDYVENLRFHPGNLFGH
uniref:Uncharacterized protein n=1 Tax=Lutzomyia longipalpis TaxID=7200 RepID=A0A1B0GKH1_LUTLO